jgi:hypothetical protein
MGNNRKYLRLPRIDSIFETKEIAMNTVQDYVINNVSHFLDGESIVVRFKNENGKILSAHVIINIDDKGDVSLSFNLNSEETIKIVETKEEPTDLDSLWLSEDTQSEDNKDEVIFGLRQRIETLEKTISSLSKLIDKHEYALTHTISGGDFLTNSVKYDLENSVETQKPSAAKYGEVYSKTDIIVTNFKLFIGYTDLHDFAKSNLYTKQYYYIKPEFFNAAGELIDPNDVNYTLISNNSKILETRFVEASKKWYLYGLNKDTAIVTCKIVNEDETELTDDYILMLESESEPYTYEPNVKHVLMKTAETFDILSANTKYLLLNEFVWCKGNNSLYFKAEDSTGAINLFKINGGGGTPDPDTPDIPVEPDTPVEPDEPTTGTTPDINVNINKEGVLELTDTKEEKTLVVDENDILNIPNEVAYLNSDDILVFRSQNTGNTTNGIEITVDENDVLELTDNKDERTLNVDKDGVLNIPSEVGYVDENGILTLRRQKTSETELEISVDGEGILDLTDNKPNRTLKVDESGILTIPNEAGYIDEEGTLVFRKQEAGETNFTINEEGEMNIKHGATIDEDGSLVLSKDIAEIDENGIVVFKQKTIKPNINVDFDENSEELNISGNITLDNGILTIVGSIDSNGVLTLNETQPSININGETLEVSSEIDEEGYLTLTNVEVDEEGYIIIK